MRTFVSDQSLLGECPTWDDECRRFWWIDVIGKSIMSCDAEGRDVVRRTLDDNPGSFALRRDGGTLIAFRRGLVLFDASNERVASASLTPEALKRERFNDGACDSRGRFWVGTMDPRMAEPTGGLYRVDPDRSLHRMTDGITLSNGIAFSPDDTKLYHCDSTPPRVYVHDFDVESGTVANRRVLVEFEFSTMGKADGCAVDANGSIWVAAPRTGKIFKFDADGALQAELMTPSLFPSSVAFGGSDLRTLFVTTLQPPGLPAVAVDGQVFATPVETPGLPITRFAG